MVIDTIMKYNKIMVDYSKNTGGGSGDESEIMLWQEHNKVTISNYDHKVKIVCISLSSDICGVNYTMIH